MIDDNWKNKIHAHDERRNIAIPGDYSATIDFCVEQFLGIAQESIQDHGYFAVALSGGSTPQAVYEKIASPEHREKIDWSRVYLFWSDERNVPPDSSESNYQMAMLAGFSSLPIPKEHIFRMKAETSIEENAKSYEELILQKIPSRVFDLILLGVGEDGHTASLFPQTHALHSGERLVVANFIPSKEVWRMTLTFPCINAARHLCVYALGKSKTEIIKKIFNGTYNPDQLPAQKIGTPSHKALWIMDNAASQNFNNHSLKKTQ